MKATVTKTCLAVFLSVFFILFAGCTTQDTTKLRIGMTKDEVIKVMGEPAAVGADENFEYLNYRISTPGGYGMVNQLYTVRLADNRVTSFGLGAPISLPSRISTVTTVSRVRTNAERPDGDDNGVRIVSVEPATVMAEKPTEFKFKISYLVKEAEGATLQISFNTRGPKSFVVVDSKTLKAGSGDLEITVKATPKDWGKLNAFTANATVRDANHRVLAVHLADIPLAP